MHSFRETLAPLSVTREHIETRTGRRKQDHVARCCNSGSKPDCRLHILADLGGNPCMGRQPGQIGSGETNAD